MEAFMKTSSTKKVRQMVFLAMMSAIVVVLQIICTFVKFGPFSITLALIPIIVGAALYGWKSGAFLGFVFGLTVYITGLMGLDGGFINLMMAYNPFLTTLLCFGKAIAAGAVAGALYAPIAKKNVFAGVLISGIAAPITNTGIFALGMMTVFYGFLSQNSGDQLPLAALFLGWIGINFIIELVVNVALGTVITRIVAVASKNKSAFNY